MKTGMYSTDARSLAAEEWLLQEPENEEPTESLWSGLAEAMDGAARAMQEAGKVVVMVEKK
jgi:hypothetical protein